MPHCLMLDDSLDVLPWARQTLAITPVLADERASVANGDTIRLKELQQSLADTQPIGSIISKAASVDQARAILSFVDAISEKTLRSTVTMTAGRGRGKSAALGLSISAAVAYGYANIFVTSPSPENLKTLFSFVFKGFDSLGYEEHRDYELVQSSNPSFNNAIVRVNIFRESHRQTIQYIQPHDAHKLSQAELLIIDEAAAIPLPLVKALFGPFLVFLASTVKGYEGTGRSLNLKLIQQLRKDSASAASEEASEVSVTTATTARGRTLREITLETPIRYSEGDPIETWLDRLLCMGSVAPGRGGSCPLPSACELYQLNRDTLFSYNPVSELFLQRMMGLYVASHYKNTPNDLQMMADAPAHQLYCLLGPVDSGCDQALPEIYCVVQVALEGEISKASAQAAFRRGVKVAGDLIPWTLSQQYQDEDFASLSGGRIVRIATHPDYQGMGYGKWAIEQLALFYQGKISSLVESTNEDSALPSMANRPRLTQLAPRQDLPPLLRKLSELVPERLDYMGVSFGVTRRLFKFWKTVRFVPLYIRQTVNELTGEHSAIMVRSFDAKHGGTGWLDSFYSDFQRRFASLLAFSFSKIEASLALSVLTVREIRPSAGLISTSEHISIHMTGFDQKRLHSYAQNLADFHVVIDLVPTLARLFISGMFDSTGEDGMMLSALQKVVLVGVGLQHRTVESIANEVGVDSSQLLALFSQTMRKFDKHFRSIRRRGLASEVSSASTSAASTMHPISQTLASAQNAAETDAMARIDAAGLSQYAIQASDADFDAAIGSGAPASSVSIQSLTKRVLSEGKSRKKEDGKNDGGGRKRKKSNKTKHDA